MNRSLRILAKLSAATLGFTPAAVLVATQQGLLPEKGQEKIAMVLLLPVGGVALLADSFQLSEQSKLIALFGGAVIWSSVLAWVCWQYARMLLGEDEPDGRPFDWAAWRIRFIIGFVIGFLLGWRFVRDSDNATILLFMLVTGAIGGLMLGAWRENFWSRPL